MATVHDVIVLDDDPAFEVNHQRRRLGRRRFGWRWSDPPVATVRTVEPITFTPPA